MRRIALFATAFWIIAIATSATQASEPYRGPVIDVHLHAFAANFFGPPPVAICVGEAADLAYDAAHPWPEELAKLIKAPQCANPFWSPTSDAALRDQTLSEIRRLNVIGVVRKKRCSCLNKDRLTSSPETTPGQSASAGFHWSPRQSHKAWHPAAAVRWDSH